RATTLKERYGPGLTETYKVDNDPTVAAKDIARIEELLQRTTPGDRQGEFSASLYQPDGADTSTWRFRLARIGEPISLSRVLPVLEHLGVEVVDELPYDITVDGVGRVWIYDFGLGPLESSDLSPARL